MRVLKGVGIVGVALLVCGCDKYSDAMPVYEEPRHHLVLERPEARVLDVQLAPNDTSLFHIHAHDIFFAVIDGSKIWSEASTGGVGHVTWNAGYLGDNIQYSFGSKIHRVGNDGDQPFRLIAVENLDDATCLDSVEAGRVELLGEPAVEDVRFRAYQNVVKPGDSVASHIHHYPLLILQSTSGQIEVMSAALESPRTLSKGEWYWEQTGIDHWYVNRGEATVTIVEIEVR